MANAVLANTIRGLYPPISEASLDAINDLEQSFASDQQAVVPRPVYKRSVAHGQAVATAILDWATTDGFPIHNNCPYVPVPVDGAWEPTPPAFNPNPLQPCLGPDPADGPDLGRRVPSAGPPSVFHRSRPGLLCRRPGGL